MMRNRAVFFIIPLMILVAFGAGAWWYQGNRAAETEGDLAASSLSEVATIHDSAIETAAGEDAASPAPAFAATTSAVKAGDIQITVQGSGGEARSVGPVDAPVTMTEYSSLTCPHCAHAHETVIPQLIKDYVETGKLRIIFNDFPLNQQAMDASKVSRCIPNNQYFSFLTLLFGSIEQWAANHPAVLIQDAVLAGLSEDTAKACMADAEVEKTIVEGVQAGMQKYKISSTPTFVFNDGAKIIAGARPYAEFKAAIDEHLTTKQ
jgi:protein-disulfide isomerase